MLFLQNQQIFLRISARLLFFTRIDIFHASLKVILNHGCTKFMGPLIFSPPPKCEPDFLPQLQNSIWPLGPYVKGNLNFLLHFWAPRNYYYQINEKKRAKNPNNRGKTRDRKHEHCTPVFLIYWILSLEILSFYILEYGPGKKAYKCTTSRYEPEHDS